MTNLAFTALIKNKGYNKQRLADVCGLSKTQMSNRINGANDWRWPEVGKDTPTPTKRLWPMSMTPRLAFTA